MERRFEVRKQEILNEAKIKPSVSNQMTERLEQFTVPFIERLKRPEPKAYAEIYIGGLLSDLQRKNVESIAYRYDLDRQNLQRFVGWAPWDHHPLIEELAQQVGLALGQEDAVIVFDPSGFKKWGTSWGRVLNIHYSVSCILQKLIIRRDPDPSDRQSNYGIKSPSPYG